MKYYVSENNRFCRQKAGQPYILVSPLIYVLQKNRKTRQGEK